MSVVVVGVEHQVAPLDVLERVTVGDADAPKVLADVRGLPNLEEAVLLSTCLRTEVYAVVDRFHDAVTSLQELLAGAARMPVAELQPYCSVRFDDDVPGHLFAVASGLESAVLGETEVLGQVRRAWERAHHERVSGPVLAGLFRHAVQTGKRVRSETGIARGTTSFAHAAVEQADLARPGGLSGARVVVVGAGSLGAGVVGALVARRPPAAPAGVVVVNRTVDRAEQLALASGTGVPVRGVSSAALAEEAAEADLVMVAIGAGQVLGSADMAPGGDRSRRPVVVIDLGMPRSVDPALRAVPGVTLFDMDDLRSSVEGAFEGRRGELERARDIVQGELEQYRLASRARGAAPVVASLRSRLEELREAELVRRRHHLGDLPESAWHEVDGATRAVLAKLLHEPTVILKEAAGTPRGERLVEALRILFDL